MSSRLTGKTRFRIGYFGRIIPQVQVEYHILKRPAPSSKSNEYTTLLEWRDARASDVLILGQLIHDHDITGANQ